MDEQKLQGVNFGGWLLLERWMTPSLFEGTDAKDEYEFMQTPGVAEKIDHHRKSFITESDFVWLKANAINAIRIPVGYWVLQDDLPFVSAARYLDWAMDMAKKYNIQVIIDLHGLKGSQNGHNNSGKDGKAEWFRRAEYRRSTLDTLEQIAKRYKKYENFWGLQIINEPKLGLFHVALRRYYRQAYSVLRATLKPHTRIIFSDGFTPRLLSGALTGASHPVAMDVHFYHWTMPLSRFLPMRWYMSWLIRQKRMLKRLCKQQPIIIGEWSGVMRHEKMRKLSQAKQDKLFREYARLQIELFSTTSGWFYWSYKTESPGVWDFRSQVENGNIVVIKLA